MPELYGRIGHHTNMVDADWEEFCFFCRTVIALGEETQDRGQNLRDKSTTITRDLAWRSGLPAFLVAWKGDPIATITAAWLTPWHDRLMPHHPPLRYPRMGTLLVMRPDEWLHAILILHRRHHATCPRLRSSHPLAVRCARLAEAETTNPFWRGTGQMRWPEIDGAAA